MMTNDDSAFQIPPPSSPPAEAPLGEPAAPTVTFAELGLHADVLRAVEEMGFTEPMPVQAATMPLVVAGRDLMVQSRTGSGKTAAFGIPFASNIVRPEEKFVQAIVLLPTRELALQVASELAKICAHRGITVVPIYGGAPMGRQVEQLHAGGQIVCGTPGRVLDHLRRGTLRLDRVRCAVLDECDEMLSMGFQEDIEDILEKTPAERQTLLFSATVPEGIQRLSRRYLRNPEFLKLSADYIGVYDIKHLYYSIPAIHRENELLQILAFEEPISAIIFCNTREETGRVAEFLRQHGHDAEAISSDLSQSDRERVLGRMRAGGIKFLVATDVAARGIDIENLSHVFNYTFPESPEIYVHRTGRTGRAGRKGTAVSLIGPTEVGSFYYLKLLYKIKPEERALPSEAEIRSHREGERVLVLRRALTAEPGPEWRALARRLIGAIDGERLTAALLAHSFASVEGMPVAPAAPAVPVAPRAAAPSSSSSSSSSDAPRGESHDRPRDRDRGRPSFGDRPNRDRPDRSSRGPRNDRGPRDDRGPRSDRAPRDDRGPRRPERPAPAPLRNDPPPAEREFWEVWGEERAKGAADPTAAAPTPQASSSHASPSHASPSHASPSHASPPPAELPSERTESDSARPSTPDNVTRLYLNLGRKDGASEQEVRDLLATHVGPVDVSEIDVMNTHTYVNVAPTDAEKIVGALTGKELGGRQIVCEQAKPRRR
ncbi:MAG TPA: DEAD/DEAH box helicase [Polyangia bacterium]|jgi:ATP-dependent RNA helicase DeaD|nr:DEAD/DEAH box helicase [Polyangia bacterium]